MRRMGWMTTAMIVCLCCVGFVASAATKNDGNDGSDGFEALVRVVDARYHVHGKGVPMMWGVSLVARGVTHGGVRGLRVVTYERLPVGVDRKELEGMVQGQMGEGWSPMVRSFHAGSGESAAGSGGETSLVYVRPAGRRVEMVVVSLEAEEMNLVRMELSPEALARWEKEGH